MDINNFGEIVGVNRCLNHRVFNNLADAVERVKKWPTLYRRNH